MAAGSEVTVTVPGKLPRDPDALGEGSRGQGRTKSKVSPQITY